LREATLRGGLLVGPARRSLSRNSLSTILGGNSASFLTAKASPQGGPIVARGVRPGGKPRCPRFARVLGALTWYQCTLSGELFASGPHIPCFGVCGRSAGAPFKRSLSGVFCCTVRTRFLACIPARRPKLAPLFCSIVGISAHSIAEVVNSNGASYSRPRAISVRRR